MQNRRFAFGTFVLDVASGSLRDGGVSVNVGQKGLALLEVLLEANGEIVTKTALMDAVWPNTSIEESNLSVQIAALRKCLGRAPTARTGS